MVRLEAQGAAAKDETALVVGTWQPEVQEAGQPEASEKNFLAKANIYRLVEWERKMNTRDT